MTVTKGQPFHETIVLALTGALTPEHALLYLRLLDITTIPKGHDEIILAIDGLNRFSLTRSQCENIEDVKEGLFAKKQAASQNQDGQKRYEVVASRHDASPYVVASEKFEGDDKAKSWFREDVMHRPNLQMDWLRLVKVDQERVEVPIDHNR